MAEWVEHIVTPIKVTPELYTTTIYSYSYPEAADYKGKAAQYEVEIKVPEILSYDTIIRFFCKALIKAKTVLEARKLMKIMILRGPKVPVKFGPDQRMFKLIWWSHGSPFVITSAGLAALARVFIGVAAAFVGAAILIVVVRGRPTHWPQAIESIGGGVKWWSIATLAGIVASIILGKRKKKK